MYWASSISYVLQSHSACPDKAGENLFLQQSYRDFFHTPCRPFCHGIERRAHPASPIARRLQRSLMPFFALVFLYHTSALVPVPMLSPQSAFP